MYTFVASSNQPQKKIVIMDFVSEKNRGDAALQVGLTKLIRDLLPNAQIYIISAYGSNQFPEVLPEFDHSVANGEVIFGGIVPTYFPTEKQTTAGFPFYEIKNIFGYLSKLWILLALKINFPLDCIKSLMTNQRRVIMEVIEHADLIIIKGKNYRRRKTKTLEIIRVATKMYNLWLSSFLKKEIFLIGVSIWEQRSRCATKILANAFRSCRLVTVREEYSFSEFKKIAIKNKLNEPVLIPDLSFNTFDERNQIINDKKRFAATEYPLIIGLTLLEWKKDKCESRQKYLNSISQTISHFSARGGRFVIIPQVTSKWDNSSDLIKKLIEIHGAQKIEVIHEELSERELLHVYANLDILIGTRMHSTIFAAAVGTPFVAIANDSGGKWNIVEELGYSDYLIDYLDVTPELLIDRISSCWTNKNELVQYASQVVEKNISEMKALEKRISCFL